MYRLRMQSSLVLGAALLAGCSDRKTPTAPSAPPLAATAAVDHSYTWTVKCSGDGPSDAVWVWAAAGAALASGRGTCYPSSSPISGSGVRPGAADSLRACIWQFNNARATCQSWTFDAASAFKAQLKSTSTYYFFGSKLTATATLNIAELIGSPTGDVQVTASTTGAQIDPDGYAVAIDGGAGQPLAVNGTVTFSQLSVGDHSVALSGLAANCTVSGPNPVTVTVPSGATVQTAFQITCAQVLGVIAFERWSNPGAMEIYVMNAGGSGATRLTNDWNDFFNGLPAWSPDGAKIAFVSDRDGYNDNYEIYVMNADGSSVTRLTNSPGYDLVPAWSPDGKRIAFESSRDGNHEIYVMNADGSNAVNLSQNAASDGGPAWSPDGTRIAFATDRDGNSEIYIMKADGSGVTRLTRDQAGEGHPAWSPDGAKIAFERDDGSIYVMNADGSGVTRLTRSRGSDTSPAWSPDGTKIAFVTANYEIYVMNPDGSGQTSITNGGFDAYPAWRPR